VSPSEALGKIDTLLAQASYISLERESAKNIGSFYVLLNKPISTKQEVTQP